MCTYTDRANDLVVDGAQPIVSKKKREKPQGKARAGSCRRSAIEKNLLCRKQLLHPTTLTPVAQLAGVGLIHGPMPHTQHIKKSAHKIRIAWTAVVVLLVVAIVEKRKMPE